MNDQAFEATTQISFGKVVTQIQPGPGFNESQVLNALLLTSDTALRSWVADKTKDQDGTGGSQQRIRAMVSDGRQDIATIVMSVPTTPTFTKGMFEEFLTGTIVPALEQVVRSYPSSQAIQKKTQAGQDLLETEILPGVLDRASKVTTQQLLHA